MERTETQPSLSEMASELSKSEDFRVLRRISPDKQRYFDTEVDAVGLVVDTETTGIDIKAGEKTIEIGAVLFSFNSKTGEVGEVLEKYSSLQDPGFPIKPEVSKVHGIYDEDVRGQAFDKEKFSELCSKADILICHNSGFDRPFLEQEFPELLEKTFVCSYSDLSWTAEGFESSKLKFIAIEQGKFYHAHRALSDCEALLDVLSEPLPLSQVRPLALLATAATQPAITVGAYKSPYSKNDALRGNGFRWNKDDKIWERSCKSLDEAKMAVALLQRDVYLTDGPIRVEVRTTAPNKRFSSVIPPSEYKDLNFLHLLNEQGEKEIHNQENEISQRAVTPPQPQQTAKENRPISDVLAGLNKTKAHTAPTSNKATAQPSISANKTGGLSLPSEFSQKAKETTGSVKKMTRVSSTPSF